MFERSPSTWPQTLTQHRGDNLRKAILHENVLGDLSQLTFALTRKRD